MKTSFKETLVISVGATPQIVTETLWYYTYNKLRIFDRIILLTTSTGKQKINEELFDKNWLNKLEKSLSLPKNHYIINDESIIVIKDNKGNELDDIRTSRDCEDMMMHVFSLMDELTNDPNDRLTIVIAGGRKTMPATLALAASIYGRKQDEMVHVMIDDALFWTDWYFPTDPDDPKQKVEISQIPYLRMKNFISGINVDNPLEAVSITQTRLDELSPLTNVVVDGNKIIVDDQEYKFAPAEMQLWRYMAKKKIEQCVREDLEFCGSCNECFSTHSELVDEFDDKIAEEYFTIVKEGSASWDKRKKDISKRELMKTLRSLNDKDTRVRELKSKLKSNLKQNILDPRVYHELKLIDEQVSNEASESGVGFRVDKNALILNK